MMKQSRLIGGTCLTHLALIVTVLGLEPPAAKASDALWQALRTPGHVALMRHSLAPGSGDPSNFDLNDCSTQRNLSDEGRAQARRVGEEFRSKGIEIDAVYSSSWCRCLETADLLGRASVQPLDALNSQMNLGSKQEDALRVFLMRRGESAPPIMLVTHSSNIQGLISKRASSGEVLVVRIRPGGEPEYLGSLGVL